MAINIVLNKKKANDDFGHLGLQSIKNNKKVKKSLGIKINENIFNKYFNKEFNQFEKNNFIDTEDINNKIRVAIYALENNIAIPKKSLNVVQIIGNESIKDTRKSFIEYFKSRIPLKKTEGHKVTLRNVLSKLNKYLAYIGKSDLYFDEFDGDFLKAFKNYCLVELDPRKLSENGFKNYQRIIKSVYNDANNHGHYTFQRNPFVNLRYSKDKKTEKNPLSPKQINKLMNLKFDDRLELAKTIFYFQILNNGMRCSDVMFLRYGNFKNGILKYTMMKTKSEVTINVGVKTMRIIGKLIGDNRYDNWKFTKRHHKTPYEMCNGLTISQMEKDLGYLKGYNPSPINDYRIDTLQKGIKFATDSFNEFYIDYIFRRINQQDQDEFLFLKLLSPKAATHFHNIGNTNIEIKVNFTKYQGIRSLYHQRLRRLTELYNEKIALSSPERYKHIIKLTPHTARNTFVSLMISQNVDVYKISRALAHSELKTTESYIKSGFDNNASTIIKNIIHDLI